ncbi:MAG: AAA family ATPase [Nitrospirota bacterium]|nr:AAA family ATPase [Nitrospirota bacterium]
MNIKDFEVALADLRRTADPAEFPFATTAELSTREDVIGQQRAVSSLEFGLGIKNHGYNIYVSGVPGTGRNSIVRSIVKRISLGRPVPEDWCFINNFKDADRPHSIKLAPGRGREFQHDMEKFIELMLAEIPKVFESKEYEEQKTGVQEQLEHAKEVLFEDTAHRAQDLSFQLTVTRTGIVKVPLFKGKTLQPEDAEKFTPEQRLEIEDREKKVDAEIRDFLSKARLLDKEAQEKIRELNRKIAHFAMGHQLDDLKVKYRDNPRIPDYLSEVEEDILGNLKEFLGQTPELPFHIEGMDRQALLERYRVNVLVDNSRTRGGPVVEEANPTYNNLVGRIERKARFGALFTNFTMIKSGSVLQANGGYLIMNALDVLRNPFSWDALKRIIKKSEVKIEDIAELYGVSTAGIKPEPIPVSVKVIMLGSPWLYYLLYSYDEDFRSIFKVRSDFDTQVNDSADEKQRYANFIGNMAAEEKLLAFTREAVAGIVDHAARLAEKKGKLSLRFSDISDIVREASYWAGEGGAAVVGADHVDKALDARIYRGNLLEERIQELLTDGTILVDVSGAVAGQVNGLSVYDLGDFSFGKPSRITCSVHLGKAGVVDIEREAKLSGRIYNKGVLILSGYLGGTYARDRQLSLSASIAFEQSYGDIEGDSASIAELVALLSAVTGVPARQDFAITGSINQKGEVQPIGGVNEKIEGFFAVCKARGLTGDQGVVIPRKNVMHLMLKKEVVQAVKEGKFRIYAVSTADEALFLMTGVVAGERKTDGTWPEGTLNYLVDKRLKEIAKKLKADEKAEAKDKEKEKEKKEENNETPPPKPTVPGGPG